VAGLKVGMPSPWRHTQARLACMAFGSPARSYNYWPKEGEWQPWAVRVYRSAVEKNSGPEGTGPKVVASWLSMRAGRRGWWKLFEFWADRAHRAGVLDSEFIESPLFVEASSVLALDERIAIGFARFVSGYEETMGYPLKASPMGSDR